MYPLKFAVICLLFMCYSVRFQTHAEENEAPTNGKDASATGAASSLSVAELTKRGDELVQERRYALALEAYNAAISKRPDDYSLYFKRSMVQTIRGNPSAAVKDLDQVLALNDKHVPSLVRRGKLQLQLGRFDQAGSDLERVVNDLKPTDSTAKALLEQLRKARTQMQQAQASNDQGKYASAVPLWTAVLQIARDCEACLYGAALAHFHAGDIEQVLGNTMNVLKMNPRNMEAIWLRAQALQMTGKITMKWMDYCREREKEKEKKRKGERRERARGERGGMG